MLSRRVFQQLTDSLLLGPRCRLAIAVCPPQQDANHRPRSRVAGITALRASSSSTRWKSRQGKDFFAREARVQGLKSRAAFKLLQLNEKHKLFKPGQTVVDLGYAPGSWSQVAVNRTNPRGRVIGIDLIPAQPPRGVSTIQGDFLSPAIQEEVRAYVRDPELGRLRRPISSHDEEGRAEAEVDDMDCSSLDIERQAHLEGAEAAPVDPSVKQQDNEDGPGAKLSRKERDVRHGRVVDVVLSDMMMNTSGNAFRDHAGSMDLCMAALTFAFDTLKTGGHFMCKYYQGSEDRAFETKLKRLFAKVYREKPDSSRNESKEAYFVALRRKDTPTTEDVFRE